MNWGETFLWKSPLFHYRHVLLIVIQFSHHIHYFLVRSISHIFIVFRMLFLVLILFIREVIQCSSHGYNYLIILHYSCAKVIISNMVCKNITSNILMDITHLIWYQIYFYINLKLFLLFRTWFITFAVTQLFRANNDNWKCNRNMPEHNPSFMGGPGSYNWLDESRSIRFIGWDNRIEEYSIGKDTVCITLKKVDC